MKTLTLFLIIALSALNACSFETYSSGCPAYSHQNKATRHGIKSQNKFAHRHGSRML